MPNGDHPPLMYWNLTDFLQCVEVERRPAPRAPELHHCTFVVHRGGLKLLLTIAASHGDVRISLFRENGSKPLIDLVMTQCRGVLYAVRDGLECLEFAPSKLYDLSSGFDDQYLIDFGVRVSVRPDISLQFFESSSARKWPPICHLE